MNLLKQCFVITLFLCCFYCRASGVSLERLSQRPFVLNDKTLSAFPMLPLIYKNKRYENVGTFLNTIHSPLSLYLLKGKTKKENEVIYVFSDKLQFVNYRSDLSILSLEGKRANHVEAASEVKICHSMTDWYFIQEGKPFGLMPHFVIVFKDRPLYYTAWIKPFWGEWRNVPAGEYRNDKKGVLMQKRDMIRYCGGEPKDCTEIVICSEPSPW